MSENLFQDYAHPNRMNKSPNASVTQLPILYVHYTSVHTECNFTLVKMKGRPSCSSRVIRAIFFFFFLPVTFHKCKCSPSCLQASCKLPTYFLSVERRRSNVLNHFPLLRFFVLFLSVFTFLTKKKTNN